MLRITDRPAAARLDKVQQGFALRRRNLQLLVGRDIWLGLELKARAQSHWAHAVEARLCRAARGGNSGAGPGARRARCRCATRQAEPMDLSDYGVACDAADAACDLARAEPFLPKLLQRLDALIVPRHSCRSLRITAECVRADAHALRPTGATNAGMARSAARPTWPRCDQAHANSATGYETGNWGANSRPAEHVAGGPDATTRDTRALPTSVRPIL